MKKLTAIFLCVSLLILSGCTAKPQKDEKVIAVSFYPVYIFTLNIAGGINGLRVECMAEQNTGCLHDYTITAKDAKLLNDCDVFVINGAGMEGFAEDLYETVENLNMVDSSKGIELICSHHDKEDEHDAHHHHHSENSHIWMSVDNAVMQVENICRGLVEAFPQYEKELKENASEYVSRLQALRIEVEGAKKQVQGTTAVTFHDAYAYLFEELGINILTTIESDEGGEPSARALGALSDEIKEENIKALFIEPSYEGSSAEILKNETGAQVYVLNPVLNGENEKTAYEDIMRSNLEIIKAVK